MGISETIIAAIIGALATMRDGHCSAGPQSRAQRRRVRRRTRMRSVLATIALMIGCIVGGYAWSALRAVSAQEELEATMDAEFTEQFAALAAREADVAEPRRTASEDAAGTAIPARNGEAGAAESLAHLPPCRVNSQPDEVGPVTCTERVAQPIALCASVPRRGACHQRARAGARAEELKPPWLNGDAGAADAGQPAHRGRDRRNTRSAPISARCAWTCRTGASTTRWRCASSSTTSTARCVDAGELTARRRPARAHAVV